MSPTTRVRVLSHVVLAGVRKLVGAGWVADAPLPPAGVCANAGMAPRITSETTTTLRLSELVRMTPPEAVRGRHIVSRLRPTATTRRANWSRASADGFAWGRGLMGPTMPLLDQRWTSAFPRATATSTPAAPEKPTHHSDDDEQSEERKQEGKRSRIPERPVVEPGPGDVAGIGQTASQAGSIGRCPDHSGESHCDHNQSDHHNDTSVHDLSPRGAGSTFGPMRTITRACKASMCEP